MKNKKMILLLGALCVCSTQIFAQLLTCEKKRDSVINVFRVEGNLNGFRILASDQFSWVDTVCKQQNGPNYQVDDWCPVWLMKGDTLVGGVPGQTAYYTLAKYCDSVKKLSCGRDTTYWEMLQVKPDPSRGYRKKVKYYVVDKDSTLAVMGKVRNNISYGNGGAWQFFVPDYLKQLKGCMETNL